MRQISRRLWTVLLVVCASPLAAQQSHPQLQLFAGWAHTSATGSDVDTSTINGIRGAVGIIIPVADHVGIMPEIGVNRDSYSQSGEVDGESFSLHTVAYNAVASFLVRPQFGSAKQSFFIVAGPTLIYQLHCSESATTTDLGSASESCTGSGSDRIDYGLTIGAGATFGPLMIRASLTQGLKNFDDSGEGSLHRRTIVLGGGFVL